MPDGCSGNSETLNTQQADVSSEPPKHTPKKKHEPHVPKPEIINHEMCMRICMIHDEGPMRTRKAHKHLNLYDPTSEFLKTAKDTFSSADSPYTSRGPKDPLYCTKLRKGQTLSPDTKGPCNRMFHCTPTPKPHLPSEASKSSAC